MADGVGDFRRFLVDMKPKTSAADPCSDLDKFIVNLDDLSTYASATKIKMESAPARLHPALRQLHPARLHPALRPEATACRGASGCFGASDLMITSMPEGRIVHWRGMALSDLLEAEG
jgi:hypothetical protein